MEINKKNFETPAFFASKRDQARPMGKMVLPITNPESRNFYHALGITQERATELADRLEEYLQRLDGQFVKTVEVYATAVSLCNNLEEVVVVVAMAGKYLENSQGYGGAY